MVAVVVFLFIPSGHGQEILTVISPELVALFIVGGTT
jgi:hypothetical protein